MPTVPVPHLIKFLGPPAGGGVASWAGASSWIVTVLLISWIVVFLIPLAVTRSRLAFDPDHAALQFGPNWRPGPAAPVTGSAPDPAAGPHIAPVPDEHRGEAV